MIYFFSPVNENEMQKLPLPLKLETRIKIPVSPRTLKCKDSDKHQFK